MPSINARNILNTITVTLLLCFSLSGNSFSADSLNKNKKNHNSLSHDKLIIYGGVGFISGDQKIDSESCASDSKKSDFPFLYEILCTENGAKLITLSIKKELEKNKVPISAYNTVFDEHDLINLKGIIPNNNASGKSIIDHFTASQQYESKDRSLYLLAAVGAAEMHIPYTLIGDGKTVHHDNVIAGVAIILLDISKGSETGGTLVHASSALAERHLVGTEAAKPEAVKQAFAEAYQKAAVEGVRLFNATLGKGVLCGEGFCAEREMVSEVIVDDDLIRQRFNYETPYPPAPPFNACEARQPPCASADCRRMDALLAHGATQALARAGRPVIAPIGMSAWTASGERSAGVHFQLSDGGLELGKRITLGADGLRDRDGVRFRVRLREIVQKDLPAKGSNLLVERVFRGFISLDWGKTAVTNGACAVDAAGETAWIGGKAIGAVIPSSKAKTPFSEPLLRGFNTGAIINALAALGGK